jgi:uncharacterized protein YciI
MTTFAVFRTAGAEWVACLGAREQPLWDEHATFMDRLFDAGHIVLGGPYADGSGALLIVEMETDSPAQVRAAFDADPWVTRDIQPVAEVKRWQLFLDARTS